MASSAVVVHNTGHEHNYCPSQSQTCLGRGPIQYIGYCTCTYTYTKVGFLFLCKLVRCKCLFKNSRLCPPLLILPPLLLTSPPTLIIIIIIIIINILILCNIVLLCISYHCFPGITPYCGFIFTAR